MKCAPLYDEIKIKQILTNPLLFNVNGHEGRITDFKIPENSHYLLLTDKKRTIGCLQYGRISDTECEWHLNILPKFWGIDNLSRKAMKVVRAWLIGNTEYRMAYTMVPEECKQVRKLLADLGAIEQIGFPSVYRGKEQQFLMYLVII